MQQNGFPYHPKREKNVTFIWRRSSKWDSKVMYTPFLQPRFYYINYYTLGNAVMSKYQQIKCNNIM